MKSMRNIAVYDHKSPDILSFMNNDTHFAAGPLD